MHLCSVQQHEYTLPHLPEIYQKPPKYRPLYIPHTQYGPNGVCIRGFPLLATIARQYKANYDSFPGCAINYDVIVDTPT